MSGGYFQYKDEELMEEVYGESRMSIGTKGYSETIKTVRRQNLLEDREISEIVFDVLGLLHEFDWYKECDSSLECYRKAVIRFKNKWLNKTPAERITEQAAIAKESLAEFAEQLMQEFDSTCKQYDIENAANRKKVN